MPRPTIAGSALNRLRHSESDNTATRCCPGKALPGSMVRPIAADAPSTAKILSDTRPAVTLIGSPPSAATSPIIHPGEIAAMPLKLGARSRQYPRSSFDTNWLG